MTKGYLVLVLLILNTLVYGQYGNEWIDYNQKYYKFPIVNSGIQRIDYSTLSVALQNNGDDINLINPDKFQIFGREKEIPLFIEDGGDGSFDNGDYLEFYADKNDGWFDKLLYENPSDIPDGYYSLASDTIFYFFSWTSGQGLRMIVETDVNYTAYNNPAFCWTKNHFAYGGSDATYCAGEIRNAISSPLYTFGEGWMSSSFNIGSSKTVNVATDNPYTGAGSPKAQITVVTGQHNNYNATPNHNLKCLFGPSSTLFMDTSFTGYSNFKVTKKFTTSSLSNTTTSFNFSIGNIGQQNDKQSISSVTVLYPHTFNFNGTNAFTFGIGRLNSKKRLSISNLAGTTPYVYIINDNYRKIPMVNNGGVWEAVLPIHSNNDSLICAAIASDNFHTITQLNLATVTGYFNDYNNLAIPDAYVIISHKKLWSSAQAYAAYRDGNGFQTVLADIDELYFQFSAGIPKHPLAIKRFMKLAIETWFTQPGNLFLLGKSISGPNETPTTGSRLNSISYNNNIVPTWGWPSSDNHYSFGIIPNERAFAIPTGRFSAFTNAQVMDYLNKVIVFEQKQDPNSLYTIADKEWQKNVVHFGGGSSPEQQLELATYLNEFADIVEDSLYGATVHPYYKNPDSPIINSAEFFEVQNLIQNGVSLITFFGHATATGGFSQNIDIPENWNNPGKYPIVIGLGCYTGDCHQPGGVSYAEQMVQPPLDGGIAFVSTVKQGFISYIALYTRILYDKASRRNYGATIGQLMQMTADSVYSFSVNGIIQEGNYNGMSLQGDPVLKLNPHNKPELILEESRVWTTPARLDFSIDSFNVNVVVTNVGRTFEDSVLVSLTRHYPNGDDSIYLKRIAGVYNRDTVVFRLPAHQSVAVGYNAFEISVDLPFSEVEEVYDEIGNNQINFSTYISSNALMPVWPYEYAIIPRDTITLKASTIDAFAPNRNYIFEIDTVDTFSSPFRSYQKMSSIGGVIEAAPENWTNYITNITDSIIFTDSTVYFWRCSPDSTPKLWYNRSFQYIKNKWGWGQAHFYQLDDDIFNNILADRLDRKFKFSPAIYNIRVSNFVEWSAYPSEFVGTEWSINGVQQDYGAFKRNCVLVGVLNPNNMETWYTPVMNNGVPENAQNYFGQANGDPSVNPNLSWWLGNRRYGFFGFYFDDANQLAGLVDMLNNRIPDGHHLVAYSYVLDNPGMFGGPPPAKMYQNWPPELFDALTNLGATGFVDSSQPDDGWIFYCKKGDPSTAVTVRTPDTLDIPNIGTPSQYISLSVNFTGSASEGSFKSTVVGPAFNWTSLYWQQHAEESNTEDTSRLFVYGITTSGSEILILDTLLSLKDSILSLNNLINANQYPKMRLALYSKDEQNLTPAQLERWQVIYDPVPECAINPKKGYYFSVSDSMQHGDSIRFAVAIQNISEFDMDSLMVHYEVEDRNHFNNLLSYSRQDSLKAGQFLIDTLKLGTLDYPGLNSIWITANPYINGIQDQIEQHFFNNHAQRSFYVIEDKINPLLDVTFDGIHIMDGDIVSPKPQISITLDDENEILLMNQISDTGYFDLFLLRPGTSFKEPIYFNHSSSEYTLYWIPAQNEKNKFKIEYNPTFTEDGVYALIVQGRDKSNNYSGDLQYRINFEVIQESTITHLFNYPNPFSTKTHFVFTLTGSELPDQVMIQIFNISGTLVKTIYGSELGAINIGNNVTSYFWDGKDDFGDQLANGLYLYRVEAKINGKDIKARSTSADKAFHNEFGKMYLMR